MLDCHAVSLRLKEERERERENVGREGKGNS
jgi:hypothetical protein